MNAEEEKRERRLGVGGGEIKGTWSAISLFLFSSESLAIEVFARQPCCMAGTMKIFCIRKNIFSHSKKNILFLPCNMAAVQNFYYILFGAC